MAPPPMGHRTRPGSFAKDARPVVDHWAGLNKAGEVSHCEIIVMGGAPQSQKGVPPPPRTRSWKQYNATKDLVPNYDQCTSELRGGSRTKKNSKMYFREFSRNKKNSKKSQRLFFRNLFFLFFLFFLPKTRFQPCFPKRPEPPY